MQQQQPNFTMPQIPQQQYLPNNIQPQQQQINYQQQQQNLKLYHNQQAHHINANQMQPANNMFSPAPNSAAVMMGNQSNDVNATLKQQQQPVQNQFNTQPNPAPYMSNHNIQAILSNGPNQPLQTNNNINNISNNVMQASAVQQTAGLSKQQASAPNSVTSDNGVNSEIFFCPKSHTNSSAGQQMQNQNATATNNVAAGNTASSANQSINQQQQQQQSSANASLINQINYLINLPLTQEEEDVLNDYDW